MQDRRSTSLNQFIAALKHYNIYQEDDQYKIICPFHGDKNPSLQINKQTGFFYCYGCGLSGGAFELVKNYEPSLSPIEIYKKLHSFVKEGKGDIGGRDVYTYTNLPYTHSFVDSKVKYKEGIKLAKDFYFNLPETNWYKLPEEAIPILRYMKHRGFTTSTLKKFGAKFTYNKNYPIVFPMYDNGIFRGYVMRTDDPTAEDQRKYMYCKSFRRSITLAGQYKTDTVILVEGFLDKLSGNQLGLKNIAAILGWKITHEQFEKLKKRKIKRIICGLDNDECGIRGYKYLKRICEPYNISVVRIRYPKNIKDFGDLLNNKKEAEKIIKQIKKNGGK